MLVNLWKIKTGGRVLSPNTMGFGVPGCPLIAVLTWADYIFASLPPAVHLFYFPPHLTTFPIMIQNLPGELLIKIARYLPYSSDRLHLASCCRRFRLSVLLLEEAYTSINVHYFREKYLRQLLEFYKIAPFFRLQSMRKFKGALIADLEDQSRVNFADPIPIKSSPIENIHPVEASS
jgi:hypothetical protein